MPDACDMDVRGTFTSHQSPYQAYSTCNVNATTGLRTPDCDSTIKTELPRVATVTFSVNLQLQYIPNDNDGTSFQLSLYSCKVNKIATRRCLYASASCAAVGLVSSDIKNASAFTNIKNRTYTKLDNLLRIKTYFATDWGTLITYN